MIGERKTMKGTRIAALVGILCLIVVYIDESRPGRSAGAEESADPNVVRAAERVLEAIRARDAEKLASLVHPEKGVRFSPYAYVDTENDLVFSRAQISRFWTDRHKYTWGAADDTGEPLAMTPSEYSARFILDRDFLAASSINVNNDQAHGSTVNNAPSAYPNATRVEYYIQASGHAGESALDWGALRLVLEKIGSKWFLVAIIHDEWTT
jgi:hypothetical protein